MAELEKRTIANLRSLAKTNMIRLLPTLKKREIIGLILSLQESVKSPAIQVSPVVQASKTPTIDKPSPPEGQEVSPVSHVAIPPPVFQSIIPFEYGATRIVALVRDPWWFYVYWEVTAHDLMEAHRKSAEARLTLRIYDLTTRADFLSFWEIEVYERIGSWYIHAGGADRTYCVDIGTKSPQGLFVRIARSIRVVTPPVGPSARLDEEWWTISEPATVSSYEDWWAVRDFGALSVSHQEEGSRLTLQEFEKESLSHLAQPPSSFTLLRR